eukprot:PhM_4_TR6217/c0_g1_i1/m.33446
MSFLFSVWVLLALVFFIVSSIMEKRAAMRGSHRHAPPAWADKALRSYFFALTMLPLCLFCQSTVVWACVLLYYPTYIDGSERTGARRSNWVVSWGIWKKIADYFSLECVCDTKLDPKRQYIVGLHPHGFLPFGTMVNMATNAGGSHDVFNGVVAHGLAASACFYAPLYRDLLLASGVVDAARYNARAVLNRGNSLLLVPGGATEALYAHPGNHTVYLRCRKGFIKLALECGADLVPVYGFGEVECYSQLSAKWPFVKSIQKKFQSVFGLSLPIVTNILPRRKKIVNAFGTPIPVVKTPQPTDEQVSALLEKYCKGLEDVFNKHAAKYIPNESERKLNII